MTYYAMDTNLNYQQSNMAAMDDFINRRVAEESAANEEGSKVPAPDNDSGGSYFDFGGVSPLEGNQKFEDALEQQKLMSENTYLHTGMQETNSFLDLPSGSDEAVGEKPDDFIDLVNVSDDEGSAAISNLTNPQQDLAISRTDDFTDLVNISKDQHLPGMDRHSSEAQDKLIGMDAEYYFNEAEDNDDDNLFTLTFGNQNRRKSSSPAPQDFIFKPADHAMSACADDAKGYVRISDTPPPPITNRSATNKQPKATKPDVDLSYLLPGQDLSYARPPGNDLSESLQRQYRLHERTDDLRPRIPFLDFPARRYWIAVLIMHNRSGHSPIIKLNSLNEKSYVWMKANRVTTVRTIWNLYQTTMMADEEDLVLLLGQEKVGDKVTAQEMDLFNDKLVVLKAVNKKHPDAKGRPLVKVPEAPEVITLD